MPRYASGDNIPDVQLQPVAAPVALNILPAAGQPTRGANDLQQLAESLAPFNQGLMQFGTAMVKQDNNMAAMAGDQLDVSSVYAGTSNLTPEQRGEEISKRFKSLIAASGAPDSANPYFQIAARQNLGRSLAMQYRNYIWDRREELTNPNAPMNYTGVSSEVTQNVAGNAIANDLYAQASFSDAKQKIDSEMQFQLNVERSKRVETLGAQNASSALQAAIAGGDLDTANTAWSAYQRTTTDPAKVKVTFLGAVEDAFASSASLEELEQRNDRFLEMQYGKASVADNLDLYADVVKKHDAARRAIIARAGDEAKLEDMQWQTAQTAYYKSNGPKAVLDLLSSSGNSSALESGRVALLDRIVKDHKLPPAMAARMDEWLSEKVKLALASKSSVEENVSKETSSRILTQISDGKIPSRQALEDAMESAKIPLASRTSLSEFYERRSAAASAGAMLVIGQLQSGNAAAISRVLEGGLFPSGVNGAPNPEAAVEGAMWATKLGQQVNNNLQLYLQGQIPDAGGKFYSEYQKNSQEEADASAKRFAYDANVAAMRDFQEQFEKNTAAGRTSKNGAFVPKSQKLERSITAVDDAKSKLADGLAMGAIDLTELPAELKAQRNELVNISKAYDFGFFNNPVNLPMMRSTIAKRLFESIQAGGAPVVTNDARISGTIIGGLRAVYEYPAATLSTGTYAEATANVSGAYDAYATKRDATAALNDYRMVARADGLSLDMVIHDQDATGLPVLGITIPRNKTEMQKDAMRVLLIRNESELNDNTAVNAVLERLGLDASYADRFKTVQRNLLQLRRKIDTEYGVPTPWFGRTEPTELKEAQNRAQTQNPSLYQRLLNSAQEKTNQ